MPEAPTAQKVRAASSAAARWLLHSGIQDQSHDRRVAGSFSAWYDRATGEYSYAYSEITGYALTTLAYLSLCRPDPELLRRGAVAVVWLRDQAYDSGRVAVLGRRDRASGRFTPWVHAFDQGMVLNGVVNMSALSGDETHIAFAHHLGQGLLRMQLEDGSFQPYQFPRRRALPAELRRKWSGQPGSFMAKNAIGLLNLGDQTGQALWCRAARGVCQAALRWQQPEGRFITNDLDNSTHVHPHTYTTEGLWVAGRLLGEVRFLEAAAAALRWSSQRQLPDGSIPAEVAADGSWQGRRTDALAQTIRMALLLEAEGCDTGWTAERLERAAGRLLRGQHRTGPERARYGFDYGHEGQAVAGPRRHVNCWATMFAIQALDLYADYLEGLPVRLEPGLLV